MSWISFIVALGVTFSAAAFAWKSAKPTESELPDRATGWSFRCLFLAWGWVLSEWLLVRQVVLTGS